MIRRLLPIVLVLTACATAPPPDPAPPASPKRVEMVTTAGTIVIRLLPEFAPGTVAQFLRLARAGVYDSMYFYRVEQGFVVQTATADDREVPLTPEQQAIIQPIPLEPDGPLHIRGVVSLAHGDDPDSGETSFSILLGTAPHLDRKYTAFGVIIDSEETLHRIEQTYDQRARDADGQRLQILRMIVEETQ